MLPPPLPIDVDKLRVLIATTRGPVEVLLLTEEDAAIGRCVACIGGTTETADIASAYHAFVVRPTGIIESRFGHSCYRLDLSGRIDAGSSWQLGVLAAHALLSAGRLAQEKDTAGAVLWVTGSVRPVDLTVGAVSHVPEKLANSLDRLKQERAAGRRVLLALPAANAAEVPQALAAELSAQGIETVALAHVQPLFDAMALQLPDSTGKVPVKGTAGIAGSVPAATPSTALVVAPRRRRWLIPAAVAVVLIAIAGTTAVVRKYQSDRESAATSSPQLASKSKVPARVLLVPDHVPFVTAQDRARIRDEYMTAPDYKALATSLLRIDFVTGQPTQEAADRAALEICEKLSAGSLVKADVVCDLYASGNVVVTRRSRPPMPAEPWIVRNPAIERPFVAAQIPLAGQEARDTLNKGYPVAARAKAVVISPNGRWWTTTAQSSQDEAVRRSLERCGYAGGVACMVMGIDDTFVIPIPTLMKVVGFYRLEGLVGVTSDARNEVAHRLADAPNAWNAIAVGAGANVGIAVNADSERSAIDGALADCAKNDQNCRVVVLGPFLVEATSQAQSQGQPQPREQTPLPAPARVPLVPEQVPFVTAQDQARIRSEYMTAPDYKALAISFTHIALVISQSSQEAADRTAIEACEKLESGKACDLYASGNVVVTRHGRPPMPAEPWLIRNRAVEQPFVATQIPMLDAADKERIANNYPHATGSKAFVLSTTDKKWVFTTALSGDEAVRRSLEHCGSIASGACMVVAIDNTFVIPIPTLARVIGFYRPDVLVNVTPQVRDEVAHRLSITPNAWNAVAIGAGRNVGIALGADSEQSALDGALADCAKHDRDCRIAVMGPFVVASP
jgi:hypothetical protein